MNKDTPSLAAVAREILRLDNWGSYEDRVKFYDNHAADLARGYLAAVKLPHDLVPIVAEYLANHPDVLEREKAIYAALKEVKHV